MLGSFNCPCDFHINLPLYFPLQRDMFPPQAYLQAFRRVPPSKRDLKPQKESFCLRKRRKIMGMSSRTALHLVKNISLPMPLFPRKIRLGTLDTATLLLNCTARLASDSVIVLAKDEFNLTMRFSFKPWPSFSSTSNVPSPSVDRPS